ncbi:RNA-binding motif protein, X-linked 2-like [Sorex araneus]|uniref:RNA-binding motif protein, X-linked 2-like n=1 Tax=Sorex araneus TaxID=42254 RepID=UPI00243398E1|nr:RNA-binding motif protein, X-linked 2-like [Sorex araneus]
MNPLTKVKLINELNEREVQLGVAEKVSWHSEYKDSAWIFLGGLPYIMTEGDVICFFSRECFRGSSFPYFGITLDSSWRTVHVSYSNFVKTLNK